MFHFGVDYYPEHWPEERWPDDARWMAEAGFNVVRLAEFAWARLEPAAGEYDFGWLDRAISVLSEQGLRIVLGTPTASPPPWLMECYPDLYRVLPDCRRLTYGLRREYCPNHLAYQDHCRRIVEQMARHYGQHPAVIGWQIDNEFGDRCYCPTCASAFQGWLRDRYGTLEAVNERWGTIFWSHVYTAWEQIPVPLSTAAPHNPGLALDFSRFCSDSYVAFQQQQLDILRDGCPGHFITHNLMGFGYDQINYFDLARPLDFVSWDNYPRNQWNMSSAPDPVLPALGHATMRGLKQRAFWVMEQQAGPAGWDIIGPAPRPGQLRLWAYQAIAHGADGIVFFRWRTAQVGAEQYWHGLLDHHGQPGRRYEEIRRMGREVAALAERLEGSAPRAGVALLLSYDSRFAFQIQQQNPEFHYPAHLTDIYRALHRLHIPVDIISPEADLAPYRLVIAPALHVVNESTAAALWQYAASGGILLVTARSGVKDSANWVVNRPLPGLLADLCGVEIEEYDSLVPGQDNALRFVCSELPADALPAADVWCEVLRPLGAETVAVYQHDFYAGRAAITRNRVEHGQVVYCGTPGKQDLLHPLLEWLLRLAAIEPLVSGGEELEIVERCQGQRRILFVLNHTDREQSFDPGGRCRNLLTGSLLTGSARIEPFDLLILEDAKESQP